MHINTTSGSCTNEWQRKLRGRIYLCVTGISIAFSKDKVSVVLIENNIASSHVQRKFFYHLHLYYPPKLYIIYTQNRQNTHTHMQPENHAIFNSDLTPNCPREKLMFHNKTNKKIRPIYSLFSPFLLGWRNLKLYRFTGSFSFCFICFVDWLLGRCKTQDQGADWKPACTAELSLNLNENTMKYLQVRFCEQVNKDSL